MVVLLEPKGQGCLGGIKTTLFPSTKEAALLRMLDLGIEEVCLDFSHFPPFHFPSLAELIQKLFGKKKCESADTKQRRVRAENGSESKQVN